MKRSSPKNFVPEIHVLGGGMFEVESRSRRGEFHAVDAHEGTCSCEDHVLSGRVLCWHLNFIDDLLIKVGKNREDQLTAMGRHTT